MERKGRLPEDDKRADFKVVVGHIEIDQLGGQIFEFSRQHTELISLQIQVSEIGELSKRRGAHVDVVLRQVQLLKGENHRQRARDAGELTLRHLFQKNERKRRRSLKERNNVKLKLNG